jgi:trans-2,3-dihydro-3-hydroxyanthranilate isomerase
MGNVPFVFVDVFTDQPLQGNPLSVIPDADQLDELTMKRIAREFNQSETTFILLPSQGGAHWRLRSFTPAGHEVVGAGHNALGAWWWLASAGKLELNGATTAFVQEIGARLLPVDILCEEGRVASIRMAQTAPAFGRTFDDMAEIARALGLVTEDFNLSRLPIQVVSTGVPHLLVPLKDRNAVARCRPDASKLLSILQSVNSEGCYLYTLDSLLPKSVAHTRFFNPTVGIVEDAATGSAAGPLAAQLVAHGVVEDGHTVVAVS